MSVRTLDIRPGRGRLESAVVGLLAAAVIGGTLAFALTRPENAGDAPLLDWQVSAFDGLSPVDQAIQSAMGPAIEEIVFFYDMNGEWPTVEQLGEDLVAPFAHDLFWEANGQVDWTTTRPGATDAGAVYYLGRHGRAEGQSAYLGLIRHAHLNTNNSNQLEFWVHADTGVAEPRALKPEALVGQGWRQVVARNGASESRRIRGE